MATMVDLAPQSSSLRPAYASLGQITLGAPNHGRLTASGPALAQAVDQTTPLH
jgi:hypothetical protein